MRREISTTLALDGERQFRQELANAGRQLRVLGSEMRANTATFGQNADSLEALTSRGEIFQRQADQQRAVVDALARAVEESADMYGEADSRTDGYRIQLNNATASLSRMEREVEQNTQAVENFGQETGETANDLNNLGNSAERMSESLQATGERVSEIGQQMSMAITAPIVAGGSVMLKGAVNAENAQNKLQASLGITAEEAEKMGAVAKKVWANAFGETIEEANKAVSTIRKNMGEFSDKELQQVTEGAMTIADVFGAEVVDSTKAAGTMMKNFGISGQDALDLITVGFQKGGDFSGELLDTLNEYSPQFASMGLSADQAMGILIAGAKAGSFNLDKVGDAMKEFNIRAQDGSKTTGEGFAAIGLDAEKMGSAIARGGEDSQKAFTATVAALAAMKNPMAQNNAGVALFGTQWEDVRAKVIFAMAEGVKGIGEFKGATDEAAAAMHDNNPGVALTMAMREFQLAVGPALLPLADIITNNVVPAVKSLADWFTNLSPAGQKTVLTIVGIVAAIGPALVIIGTLITVVASIVAGFGAAAASITAAGGVIAILTGPIAIAIAAIAAIIAIGVLLYKNWDTVAAFGIKLKDGLIKAFTAMGAGVSTKITQVKNSIVSGIQSALDWVIKLPTKMAEYGKNIIQGLINGIKSMVGSVANVVSGLAETIKGKIRGALRISSPSKIMTEIGEYTGQGLVDGMQNTMADISRQSQAMAQAVIPNSSLIIDNRKSNRGSDNAPQATNNSFLGMFQGANFYVRSEGDTKKVAQELYRLHQVGLRGSGARK